jgi:phospholipid/cholesterol/gamma-HCH transport system ATP-binding protein
MEAPDMALEVEGVQLKIGDKLIQSSVSFTVEPGTIFAVMGQSGSGKSTLLKSLVGLLQPAAGRVSYDGQDYWAGSDAARAELRTRIGMLFQSAALWSSMTVLENVCLPLEQHTKLDARKREARAREVLGWVGLEDALQARPADLSGGMKKRAGLARAIAAEPPWLFLDEPSAGLDPMSSRRLDELILELRHRTGAAFVMVSHELPSLLDIVDNAIFLDADSRQPIAQGRPTDLRDAGDAVHATVRAFLRRETAPADPGPPAEAAPRAAPPAAPNPTERSPA